MSLITGHGIRITAPTFPRTSLPITPHPIFSTHFLDNREAELSVWQCEVHSDDFDCVPYCTGTGSLTANFTCYDVNVPMPPNMRENTKKMLIDIRLHRAFFFARK